jgi:hypothetical protein
LTICALISVACSAAPKKLVHTDSTIAPTVSSPVKPKPIQNAHFEIAKENNGLIKDIIARLESIEQGLAILLNNLVRNTNHEKAVAQAKAETEKRMQAKAVGPLAKGKNQTNKVCAAAAAKVNA